MTEFHRVIEMPHEQRAEREIFINGDNIIAIVNVEGFSGQCLVEFVNGTTMAIKGDADSLAYKLNGGVEP